MIKNIVLAHKDQLHQGRKIYFHQEFLDGQKYFQDQRLQLGTMERRIKKIEACYTSLPIGRQILSLWQLILELDKIDPSSPFNARTDSLMLVLS